MSISQLKEAPYLYGRVVKGKQLGRKIGFPTANLQLNEGAPLENGVYAVYVYYKQQRHFGVMNVGNRPTFDDGEHQTYEVHILDFHENIYDELLTVEIMFYLRPEQKFQQLKDLIQQLHADVFRARRQFRSILS